MKLAESDTLLRRFSEAIRRQWLRAVRTVDADIATAQITAERFADHVIRQAILAGYREAEHLRTGVFDPTVSADRFRIERGALVSRFLTDVSSSSLRVSVGLSARQRRDLRAFAATLTAASLDAIDFNETALFNDRQAAAQARRLERAMVQQRARLIGRSEATGALSLGVSVAIEQTEAMTGNEIKRTWRTRGDEKVRSTHSTMNGQTRGLNQPFLSGNGVALMRPGDPNAPASERANCRCVLVTAGG